MENCSAPNLVRMDTQAAISAAQAASAADLWSRALKQQCPAPWSGVFIEPRSTVRSNTTNSDGGVAGDNEQHF